MRQPNCSSKNSIKSGKKLVASAIPSPESPTASPRRRTNQMLMTYKLTSESAPCPSPRIKIKPISSVTSPLTKPIHTHASANIEAMSTTAKRGPRRSMKRPTNGSEKEPINVPTV